MRAPLHEPETRPQNTHRWLLQVGSVTSHIPTHPERIQDKLYQLARRWALGKKHRIIKAPQPHGKVLDVGCGTGEFSGLPDEPGLPGSKVSSPTSKHENRLSRIMPFRFCHPWNWFQPKSNSRSLHYGTCSNTYPTYVEPSSDYLHCLLTEGYCDRRSGPRQLGCQNTMGRTGPLGMYPGISHTSAERMFTPFCRNTVSN